MTEDMILLAREECWPDGPKHGRFSTLRYLLASEMLLPEGLDANARPAAPIGCGVAQLKCCGLTDPTKMSRSEGPNRKRY